MNALQTEWTRTVFDDFLVEDLTRIARTALVHDGFLRADIKVSIERSGTGPSEAKRIRVGIVPGPQTASRTIEWVGSAAIDTKLLDQEVTRLGLQDQIWEDPTVLERPIRDLYASEGYLAAVVAAGTPQFDEDRAILPVRLEEGPAARLATRMFEGARAFSQDDLSKVAGLTVGDRLQPADQRARRAIERMYYQRGFNAARVDVQAASRPDGLVDAIVRIEEGRQQILARLEITGAAHESRARHERPQAEDRRAARQRRPLRGEAETHEIGAFRQVDVQTQPLEKPEAGEGEWRSIRTTSNNRSLRTLLSRSGRCPAVQIRPSDRRYS